MERAQRDDIVVKGASYPVKPSQQVYASCFQYVQAAVFFIIFFGVPVCNALGTAAPAPIALLSENKMSAFMLIWMFGNVLVSAFLQTGAFEIYYHDKTVWSSLDHGSRMPTYQDILSGSRRVGLELMTSSSGRP